MYLTVKSLLNQINKISHSKVCVLMQQSGLDIHNVRPSIVFFFWEKCSKTATGPSSSPPYSSYGIFLLRCFFRAAAGYLVMSGPNTQ